MSTSVPLFRCRVLVAVFAVLALMLAACEADEPDDDGDQSTADDEATEDDADDEDGDAEAASGALEGEDLTLIVPYGPGGGYDSYSRLVAPYLADELGAASVTVENMPGAGGLIGVTNIFTAEPDGTTFGIANGPGMTGSVLAEDEGVNFDLEEFTFLGRLAAEPRFMTVGAHTPWESMEELLEDDDLDFTFGASGTGGSTYTDAVLIMESLGFDADFVTGYDGTEDISLAVAAEEIDGLVATVSSTLPDVEAGDQRGMVVVAEERDDDLPDIPTVMELEPEGEGLEVAETHLAMSDLGRLMLAPAGMPDDIAQELRDALQSVLEDEEFLADAEEQGRPINFAAGEELDDMITTALNAPDLVRELLQEGDE